MKDQVEEDIQFTQSLRRTFINTLTGTLKLEDIAKDPESANVLAKFLKDMDAVSLAKLRIKSDGDNVDKLVSQKALVAEVLGTINPDFLRTVANTDPNIKNLNKISLDDSDGPVELVLGETDVGVAELSLDKLSH